MAKVPGTRQAIILRRRPRLPRPGRLLRASVPLSRLAWMVAGVTSVVWAPGTWLSALLIFGSFIIVYLAGVRDGQLDVALADLRRDRRDARQPQPTPPDGSGA